MSRRSLKCLYRNALKLKGTIRNAHQYATSAPIISPDHVLSPSNRVKCIGLLNSMTGTERASTKIINKAAVLVPLCIINGQLSLLFTVRARHMKVNAGEVAFPGGMFDESDGKLENTALREAKEEVGITPDKVDIWGKGPGYFFKTIQATSNQRAGVSVTPVLAYIGELNLDKLKISSDEVSHAFTTTLDHLCSSRNFRSTRFRSANGFIYKTPVYLNANKRIWGFTAYITHIILSCLVPDPYTKNIIFHPSMQKVMYKKK